MGSILSIEELQMILAPHAERFGRCIWMTWARYERIAEADRLTYDLSAEAKIINRYVIDNVKREFSGIAGVEFIAYDWLSLDGFPYGIEGTVLCRFKKLNSAGESRNYPTTRALAILRNDNEELAGIPERATIIDVGPVFNDWRTGFTEVQAVRVRDREFIMNFPQAADGAATMPLPLPFTPLGRPAERFTIERREVSGTDSSE